VVQTLALAANWERAESLELAALHMCEQYFAIGLNPPLLFLKIFENLGINLPTSLILVVITKSSII
jgi:hypothetical protein